MTPTSTTNPGLQNPESALTEFYAGYYGWRVVLAACLGVMAGFGSLRLYLHCLRQTSRHHFRLEP